MVAMVGPAACWSLITRLVEGGDLGIKGMAPWVPGLFYGSWLLWAIAAGAATRSYQLRTASSARSWSRKKLSANFKCERARCRIWSLGNLRTFLTIGQPAFFP